MLFLLSRIWKWYTFHFRVAFILESPTNFSYINKRKLRENVESKKITNTILEGKTKEEDIKSFLLKKTIPFINFFAYFLNLTFDGDMKKFFREKQNGINTAKKQLLLQEVKNHSVYPILLETEESYVKIKALVFTCYYVSSEPIDSREKLTDLDCIM